MKKLFLILALPMLTACGHDDRSPAGAQASLDGTWSLSQIRCNDEESAIGMFTDSSLDSGGAVASVLSISMDNVQSFRTWTIGSCVLSTPMNFSNFSSSAFRGTDVGVTTCSGSTSPGGACEPVAGLCNAPSPLPVADYSYRISGNEMSVAMPAAAAAGFCGPSQGSSLTFVYKK